MDLDEVALNTLLADGVDFPTAYAASIVDTEPQPAGLNPAGVYAALIVTLLGAWLLLT